MLARTCPWLAGRRRRPRPDRSTWRKRRAPGRRRAETGWSGAPLPWSPAPSACRRRAAGREQGVAAEQRVGFCKPEGDVASGMAGHVEDLRLFFPEGPTLAIGEGHIDARDPLSIGLRTDDGAAGGRLELEIAAGMVIV